MGLVPDRNRLMALIREHISRFFVGYLAACLAASFVMAVENSLRLSAEDADVSVILLIPLAVVGALPLTLFLFPMMALVAWIGVAILVPALWFFRQTFLLSYAVAGAVNGTYLAAVSGQQDDFSWALFFQYPPHWIVPVAGAVGGGAYWWADRVVTCKFRKNLGEATKV